ncbi:MAG: SsrA-binding protein [Rhodospirillaceae bacterium]|nr:SsrA-binding protein [Rhodospirillaceae bacterium]HAA92198.1 SsrA-binding protein [Rhodospirillaceae bacterium]
MAKKSSARQTEIRNRRARFDYFIDETLEAGLVLVGSEVKSLRAGKASLARAFAGPKNGELFLQNCNIDEYNEANRFGHEPRRPRKLLVHKRERDRLIGAVQRDGYSLIPMKLYFNDRGIAKLQLGLGKGKKKYDKRQVQKERDWNRQKSRLLRES